MVFIINNKVGTRLIIKLVWFCQHQQYHFCLSTQLIDSWSDKKQGWIKFNWCIDCSGTSHHNQPCGPPWLYFLGKRYGENPISYQRTEVRFRITLIMLADGEFQVEAENPFWRSKADNVCCQPVAPLPVDVIQGQKCLCCLIGSNSIALSDATLFRSFPERKVGAKLLNLLIIKWHYDRWH